MWKDVKNKYNNLVVNSDMKNVAVEITNHSFGERVLHTNVPYVQEQVQT